MISFARVHKPAMTIEVKNLGWLLAHKHDVEHLSYMLENPSNPDENPGMMIAWMSDGARFVSTFNSVNVWRGFIRRPSWRGVPFHVTSWCAELIEAGTI